MSSHSPPKETKQKGARSSVLRKGIHWVREALGPSHPHSPRSLGAKSPSASSGTRNLTVGAHIPHLVQSLMIQPPVSPKPESTSGPAPVASRSLTDQEPTTLDKYKDMGKVAWAGLGIALRILEQNADVFPPLKYALGGFLACLDIIQTAAGNAEGYEELAIELTTMAQTLSQYVGELDSETNTGSVAHIAKSIQAQVEHITKKRNRGTARQIVESKEDEGDILQCYRQIEKLFRQLQGEISLQILRKTNEESVRSLLRGMSPVDDARYNSSYSTTVKRRGCTPETREKIQQELRSWVTDPDGAKLFWMSGMAGTGKTTLGYSFCEWLEENNQLGASFFCSRTSTSCRGLKGIIPTISYQLARYSPAFRSELCKVLKDNPDANTLNVIQQFENLIYGPLSKARNAIPEGVVVVIDALDECEDSYGVRLILEVLLKFSEELPVKFFVASRPEPTIRDKMLLRDDHSPLTTHLHDIEESIVEQDIKKYLTEALARMTPPPSEAELDQLTKLAGKLFIYAATTVRYICPDHIRVNSAARLRTMLAVGPDRSSQGEPNKRYAELDRLYSTVLDTAFNEELEREELDAIQLVLWTTVCAQEPMTVQTISFLLGLTEEQVSSAIEPLRSVLHVSEANGLVSTLHASFPDYMYDHSRSGKFRCDEPKHNDFLARHCLDTMKEQLHFNICNLESSFVFDITIPDLDKRVHDAISSPLFYSCRYWTEHLRLSPVSDEICELLLDFLRHRLLFWMEVLCLHTCIGVGAPMLHQVQSWLLANRAPIDVQKQVRDAWNFVTKFATNACSQSTPHIYVSALPSCPKSSSVYENYWGRTRGLLNIKGTAITRQGQGALSIWRTESGVCAVAFSPDLSQIVIAHETLWVRDAHTGIIIAGPIQGHTDIVMYVAFSPDGTRLASGSKDRTIRMWSSQTGASLAEPFEGHTGTVWSVAFSPDGIRVASGSEDRTIRVWDSQTGSPMGGPFEGHTSAVYSVAFSPNGDIIASGSDDHTVRVWDSRTGAPITKPFEGHTNMVWSVEFSPDGTRIVSSSSDHTIRLWEPQTGAPILPPFEGHTNEVCSASFSPDGTRIVSGSDDRTIRVWDSRTGKPIGSPLEGHTSEVWTVAFSPDGSRIISGSMDCTVRVWDSEPSTLNAQSFDGHTSMIISVAFSPDGARIFSSSYDCTLKSWDSQTGAPLGELFQDCEIWAMSLASSPNGTHIASGFQDGTVRVCDLGTGASIVGPFEGHSNLVTSVKFSPDGNRIVSGSLDNTIRLWDLQTGALAINPIEGHADAVWSVAFSFDGARIFSGSDDCTIRVWDPQTGGAVGGPFEGHKGPIYALALSPDDSRLVSGSGDNTIIIWDPQTGAPVGSPLEGHTDQVCSVAISPDGNCIVSGSQDFSVRVWDLATGAPLTEPLLGHIGTVWSVAVSPDSTRIISSSQDSTIRIWRLAAIRSLEAPALIVDSMPTPDPALPTSDSIAVSSHLSTVRTPELKYSDSIFTSPWTFDIDGCVHTDDKLLFWVPPDVPLPSYQNSLVIGPYGTTIVEDWDLALGESWVTCYQSD